MAPAIILVRPQLGENIGMCARAMLNCAVTDMRIVAPRDGWPNPDAVSSASGAIELLERARIFDTVAEAVADLEYVLATTARQRDVTKPVQTNDTAAKTIRQINHGQQKQKCGIMFGPERTGLENDDLAYANAILNIPLNPTFSSLNLAQAVLLVCHSWLSADNPFQPLTEDADIASKQDIENLIIRLEENMEKGRFFRSAEQRPTIMRNLRNFFFRSGVTEREIQTFHGIIKSLTQAGNSDKT